MSQPDIVVPAAVRWIAKVLTTLPAPTESWAAIIGHLAWPVLILFLVLRFRWFLRSFLLILADRLETDHIKTPWFEIRRDDPVLVLDAEAADGSSSVYAPDDIRRIERMFEFIDVPEGFALLRHWKDIHVDAQLDFEEFITNPLYARDRERAFAEVEGLEL